MHHVENILSFKSANLNNSYEEILLDKLNSWNIESDGAIIPYLIDSYQRLLKVDPENPLKELLVAYSGMILLYPEMFPQDKEHMISGYSIFMKKINSLISDSSSTIIDSFLNDFIKRFTAVTPEEFNEIAHKIFDEISKMSLQMNINSNYNEVLQILIKLLSFSSFVSALISHPRWNISGNGLINGKQWEFIHLFGPLLRVGTIPGSEDFSIAKQFFPNATQALTYANVESAWYTIRTSHRFLQSSLHQIFLLIAKASPSAKESLLSCVFDSLLNSNVKRSQSQADPNLISSDDTLRNLTGILLLFSEPFTTKGTSKISFVDLNYLWQSNRLSQFNAETKMLMSDEEYSAFLAITVTATTQPPHFITEIFYMTTKCLHLGLIKTLSLYTNQSRDLHEISAALEQFRLESTNANPLAQLQLKRLESLYERYSLQRLVWDSWIYEKEFIDSVFLFYSFQIHWLFSIVDNEKQNVKTEFKALPQHMVEDIADFILFLTRFHQPRLMGDSALVSNSDIIIRFIIKFLSAGNTLIKNPYIRAKLVEILFNFTENTDLSIFIADPICVSALGPVLMEFYSEVESTGASSAFYDKFNIRYHISVIMKHLWNDVPAYSKVILNYSKSNIEDLVQFSNLLINDANYLLDEALSKLATIHKWQLEMENAAEWNAKSEAEKDEIIKNLEKTSKMATTLMQLSNETVSLLSTLTHHLNAPFLRPEIVDRLSAMLNYNLVVLVGPKCSGLKVKDPEKYYFSPKHLLSDILDIYLHLKSSKEFIKSICKDRRSYSSTTFLRAISIMERTNMKSFQKLSSLKQMVDDIELMLAAALNEEKELGEIPDDFLDPIVFTLMEDPVILPTSGVSIDRSTIIAHLLNDKHDPFNRKDLTIDMVIPNIALKQRIMEWKNKDNNN